VVVAEDKVIRVDLVDPPPVMVEIQEMQDLPVIEDIVM